jgi:hypothetical protein
MQPYGECHALDRTSRPSSAMGASTRPPQSLTLAPCLPPWYHRAQSHPSAHENPMPPSPSPQAPAQRLLGHVFSGGPSLICRPFLRIAQRDPRHVAAQDRDAGPALASKGGERPLTSRVCARSRRSLICRQRARIASPCLHVASRRKRLCLALQVRRSFFFFFFFFVVLLQRGPLAVECMPRGTRRETHDMTFDIIREAGVGSRRVQCKR